MSSSSVRKSKSVAVEKTPKNNFEPDVPPKWDEVVQENKDVDSFSDVPSEPGADQQLTTQNQNNDILTMEPPTCQINFDIFHIILFLAALCSRLYRLSTPRVVIFDELHYTRFISSYLNGTFFFDTHPPLAKMLYSSMAYLYGYSTSDKFSKIGEDYSDTTPIAALRMIPALLNCLTVPIVYQIFIELKISKWAAVIAALSILMENAMLTQSRVLMAESPLVFLLAVSILAALTFRNQKLFTYKWWFWLFMESTCIGLSLSTKYISLMTVIFILTIHSWDIWQHLSDEKMDISKIISSTIIQLTSIISVVIAIYMVIFYIHLALLTKAGSHDNMTSRFQASLEGGLQSITQGQPLNIAYGSQVTLRRSFGQVCWLHSHKAVYPVRYEDGRGSSHQQQITCYVHKDVNNWWFIKDPKRDVIKVDDPIVPIKHGDIIELVHVMTKRKLNSHDVAAPVTPSLQEVSGYIDYNISMAPRTLWRVEITNRETDGNEWHTIRSHVRFVHVNSSEFLRTTEKTLPEWGFRQIEVATDKLEHGSSVWNVEEHKYSKQKDQKETEPNSVDLVNFELIPTQSLTLSFWEKFSELQWKMLMKKDTPFDHRFSSSPSQWPHGSGNVVYWLKAGSYDQIHLIGNLTIWLSALLCILIQVLILAFFLVTRARSICPFTEMEWQRVRFLCLFSTGGYLLHYLPFHFLDYTYFLYHYMPALLYKLWIVPCTLEIGSILCREKAVIRWTLLVVSLFWLSLVAYNFVHLLPLSYGSHVASVDELVAMRLHPSWDFIF